MIDLITIDYHVGKRMEIWLKTIIGILIVCPREDIFTVLRIPCREDGDAFLTSEDFITDTSLRSYNGIVSTDATLFETSKLLVIRGVLLGIVLDTLYNGEKFSGRYLFIQNHILLIS